MILNVLIQQQQVCHHDNDDQRYDNDDGKDDCDFVISMKSLYLQTYIHMLMHIHIKNFFVFFFVCHKNKQTNKQF